MVLVVQDCSTEDFLIKQNLNTEMTIWMGHFDSNLESTEKGFAKGEFVRSKERSFSQQLHESDKHNIE